MDKNEQKSDEADLRLHKEISAVRNEMRALETKFTNNDREIYGKLATLGERITRAEK